MEIDECVMLYFDDAFENVLEEIVIKDLWRTLKMSSPQFTDLEW